MARQFTLLCIIAMKFAGLIGRRKRKYLPGQKSDILLTGRFDSDNWILAHLGPLSASKECEKIWMVSTNPVPKLEKIEPVYPPKWLIKVAGTTQARVLTFLWAAICKRPHIVGGFHIMPNGIAAAITGLLAGAKTMYFCVGGPAEILGGGAYSSDSYFEKMEIPDIIVEKRLLRIISKLDIVITMGTRAINFFRDNGVKSDFQVVSGGIDTKRFKPVQGKKDYDCIMTGRLVEVKRIDIFLQAVRLVSDKIPDIKVAIAGDGKLLTKLKKITNDLNISNNVDFVGHQNNVENWLCKSKIFVLTSDSEGLSLSMMEAMMCGLPVIVSDVGDLGDLVENGVNGYLVPRRKPKLFAERFLELLSDESKLEAFSHAACQSASRYSIQAAIHRWDSILAGYSKK